MAELLQLNNTTTKFDSEYIIILLIMICGSYHIKLFGLKRRLLLKAKFTLANNLIIVDP